jgi:2-(1,2-epoxy-1,2-dihydrophenyl)acetyl-CoA isomerase
MLSTYIDSTVLSTEIDRTIGCRAMSPLETVNVHRRGAAAVIELNRPETMNAWNKQFGADLRQAVDEVAGDDAVRAVCITGAGRGFSSGADLRDVSADQQTTAAGRPDLRRILAERYHPIITTVRTMPKPVVAAVNGPAVGIGLSLALASDLVVAKESAYFLLAFVNIGLVPDGGSSLLVPERVGFTRAIEMAMLGERIPAPRAVEWGLINRAIPDDDFASEVDALVDRLAAGPTRSYAGTKRQLNAWAFARMEQQLDLEAEIQGEMADSDDFAEGVAAFLQKRASSFQGR